MVGRYFHGQNRRKAEVGAFHDLAPIVAGLGLEDSRQLLLECGPGLRIHLRIETGVREPRVLAQQRVELRLDRADRNEPAAGALIDAIEMRAAIEEIAVALI